MDSWWVNTTETKEEICRAQMLRVDMRRPEERLKRQEAAFEEAYEDADDWNHAERERAEEWFETNGWGGYNKHELLKQEYCAKEVDRWDYDDNCSAYVYLTSKTRPLPVREDYVYEPDVSWLPEASLNHTEWHQRLWQEELYRRKRRDAYLGPSSGYTVSAEVRAKCAQLRWELVREYVRRLFILRYWRTSARETLLRSLKCLEQRREAWKAGRARRRWELVRRCFLRRSDTEAWSEC